MTHLRSIVVKVGTSSLTDAHHRLSESFMLQLVQQLALLHAKGSNIVLVSSGAVTAGRQVLHNPKLDSSLPAKQMLAAVGQVRLMETWTRLFQIFGLTIGQILFTKTDFNNRTSYLNIRDTLFTLLTHGVIPIVNENDTVATDQLKVGDNDNLSAYVANMIAADRLILLTDQEGLYTANPRKDPNAKLIPKVDVITDEIRENACGSSGATGTGGMYTKLQAAERATRSGTSVTIANYHTPSVLSEILQGKEPGTFFPARTSALESRKRWLIQEKVQGTLVVDSGAEEKIRSHGASLLAVGVVEVRETFSRGAVVRMVKRDGEIIAIGQCSYSSNEIEKILGSHSKEIEEILGYSYGTEVVHRDSLTLWK